MEIKKDPKVDLRKNSSLYFVIGLCIILFITWRAIEWKSYEKDLFEYQTLDVNSDDEEEIPITEQIKTPPPPPPPPAQAPTEIEVVKDEEEVEETIIKSTETDEDEIVDVDTVEI